MEIEEVEGEGEQKRRCPLLRLALYLLQGLLPQDLLFLSLINMTEAMMLFSYLRPHFFLPYLSSRPSSVHHPHQNLHHLPARYSPLSFPCCAHLFHC
jgi:hypothetical protein